MINIGIIAGGGKLPIAIGRSLIKKKYNICFFVIEEFFNTHHYKDYEKIEEIQEIIEFIKKSNKRGIASLINE